MIRALSMGYEETSFRVPSQSILKFGFAILGCTSIQNPKLCSFLILPSLRKMTITKFDGLLPTIGQVQKLIREKTVVEWKLLTGDLLPGGAC